MGLHVLVPIDGSDQAWEALEYATEQFPIDRLTVLHVVDPTEGDYYHDDSNERAVKRSERLREETENRLEAIGRNGFELETVTGKPAKEIVSYAENNGIDHTIMGSRGRSGLSRLLLGSVAETVVRRSKVPVTIVR